MDVIVTKSSLDHPWIMPGNMGSLNPTVIIMFVCTKINSFKCVFISMLYYKQQ